MDGDDATGGRRASLELRGGDDGGGRDESGHLWTVDGALAWSACVAGRRRGGRFRLRDERSCDDELDVGARGNATRQAPRSS